MHTRPLYDMRLYHHYHCIPVLLSTWEFQWRVHDETLVLFIFNKGINKAPR